MNFLDFLKEYWVIITFFAGEIGVLWAFVASIRKGIKCSLRNDITDIYEKCKVKGEITQYQLQCVHYSYDVYRRLHGNTFVKRLVEEEFPKFKITY